MAKPMPPEVSKQLLSILQVRSDLLVFELLLRTGIRTHEIKTLTLGGTTLHVTAAKGSNDHVMHISPEFAVRLEIHWPTVLTDLAQYSHESFKAILRARWQALKAQHTFLAPYSLHSLRGAFALLVYQETKDPLLVQECLGHRSIQSTMSYVRQARIHDNRDKILKAVG